MAGIRTALTIREFRALLVSYAINRAGDVIGSLALAVVVLGLTGSALATAVLFLATQFLPGLIGPPLVARIDRIAPGRLLPPLYLVECVLFALLAVIAGHVGAAPIIVLALVDATLAFAARTVTRSATASTLVPHDLVPEGKAAFNVGLAAAMIGGPVLGGLAVALFGSAVALAVDAASFLAAGVLIWRAAGLRATPESAADPAAPGHGRLREGLRYIASHPGLRALIAGEGIAFVFFYLVVPVTVVYATRSLHAGAGAYAAILAAWGVGIALGSAVQIRLARRVGQTMILLSTGAVAVGYLGTAVAPTIAVACAVSVIGGIGNGTQWVSVETALHQLVDEAFRTRTTAVLEALAAIAPGVGILLGGVLAAAFSPRAAYLVAGVGLVALIAAGKLSRLSLAPRPEPGVA
ncbi:MAG TPA: MFS transporter [Solirubrobacteraceae bacterium]|nr:MFS transporter [Solirubrobacteraceae bacterium]